MENNIESHINLLGKKATDAVTGFSGVISTISFDLYGCIQAVIDPPVDEKGDIKQGKWFDITRLNITDDNPVMLLPDFSKGYISEGKKGAADKPLP